jgi:uncharacterized protein
LNNYDRKSITLEEILAIHKINPKCSSSEINEGILYYYGWGREQDKKKAKELLEKHDHSDAYYYLALIYEEEGSYGLSIKLYDKLDSNGGLHYADASGKLGYYYHMGLACEASEKYALQHYFEDRDNPVTQYHLAIFFEKDSVKSKYWYELSAKNGYGPAIFNLALLEEENNPKRAMRLYKKLDDPDAQCNLANMYLKRGKVEEAIKLYKKSAKEGNMYACHNLSLMYEQGMGVKKSYKRAFKYMRMWLTNML